MAVPASSAGWSSGEWLILGCCPRKDIKQMGAFLGLVFHLHSLLLLLYLLLPLPLRPAAEPHWEGTRDWDVLHGAACVSVGWWGSAGEAEMSRDVSSQLRTSGRASGPVLFIPFTKWWRASFGLLQSSPYREDKWRNLFIHGWEPSVSSLGPSLLFSTGFAPHFLILLAIAALSFVVC